MPRLLGGMQQQHSMPAADIFHAADGTQSRLAYARSMLSKKLSFSRAARPVAASKAAAAVGSAAAVTWGRRKAASVAALADDAKAFAQRRSGTGLDSWKNGPEGASFSSAADTDVHSEGKGGAGSEWDVVSTSLDESGGGQDFEAGLGVRPDLAPQDQIGSEASRARRRRLRFSSIRTDDHDRSLTPIWPLSLYPLSYRERVSVEQKVSGVSSSSPGDTQQLRAASVSASAESSPSVSAYRAEGNLSACGETVLPRGSAEEADCEAAALGMQSCLPELVSIDAGESSSQEQRSSASTGVLVRRPEPAGQVQKQRQQNSGVVGQAANNAVPAQPISRLMAVRRTAVRAGKVVLGASAFGARVSCYSCSSHKRLRSVSVHVFLL